jgi:predicted cupin superfamily sugar epimerase
MTAEEVIRRLNLRPHPREGGYYFETYRSDELLPGEHLPVRYGGPRSVCTAIYYLLTDSSFSEMHRLQGDEIFHFYAGDPVEMLNLTPGGGGTVITIGADLAAGQVPQVIVPRGVWQGSRLVPGGDWALLGTTVAPGFDFADYEPGRRQELYAQWPDHMELIRALTHG